jgi:hypothetical protein
MLLFFVPILKGLWNRSLGRRSFLPQLINMPDLDRIDVISMSEELLLSIAGLAISIGSTAVAISELRAHTRPMKNGNRKQDSHRRK